MPISRKQQASQATTEANLWPSALWRKAGISETYFHLFVRRFNENRRTFCGAKDYSMRPIIKYPMQPIAAQVRAYSVPDSPYGR